MCIKLHNIKIPFNSLFQSTLITGQTGSGKTRGILRVILRQLVEREASHPERKCGFLVIDPKGDMVDWLGRVLEQAHRSDDLVLLSPGTSTYNPLASPFHTASSMTELLIEASSQMSRSAEARFRADDRYWELSTRNWLQTVIEVAQARSAKELALPQLFQAMHELENIASAENAQSWLDANHQLSLTQETRAAICANAILAETTRTCICQGVRNILAPWCRPPLSIVATPDTKYPSVDLFRIVEDGACVLVTLSQPAWGTVLTPLISALKSQFAQIALSRPQIDIVEAGTTRPLNTQRPVFLVVDEFQRYFSASPEVGEANLLDMSREFRVGAILATQSLSSMISVAGHSTTDRLLSLCGTQIYLANTCSATTDHAARILGTRRKRHVQRTSTPDLPPPLLFPDTDSLPGPKHPDQAVTYQYLDQPVVTPGKLAALRQGEFYIRLANGLVEHGKARAIEA